MCFAEEGRNVGNRRRNVEVLCLADLALVAGSGVPTDIVVNVRPPESNENVLCRSEDSFVTKMIMRVLDYRGTSIDIRN